METLDQITTIFGISGSKFFAQLVLFITVYFILDRFAFGPVLKMLTERRQRIEEAQLNAEKVKRQLAEAELRYQEILRKANDDASKLLDETRTTNEAHIEQAAQQAITKASAIMTRANEEIAQDRARMMTEVKNEIASLVLETTSRIVGKVLTDDDRQRLTEETKKSIEL